MLNLKGARGALLFVGLLFGGGRLVGGQTFFLDNAIKQAHTMSLLPQNSVVEHTAPGIQAGYYYIKPFERASLNSALGGAIPLDVIQSLEQQVDGIGAEASSHVGVVDTAPYPPSHPHPHNAQPSPPLAYYPTSKNSNNVKPGFGVGYHQPYHRQQQALPVQQRYRRKPLFNSPHLGFRRHRRHHQQQHFPRRRHH